MSTAGESVVTVANHQTNTRKRPSRPDGAFCPSGLAASISLKKPVLNNLRSLRF